MLCCNTHILSTVLIKRHIFTSILHLQQLDLYYQNIPLSFNTHYRIITLPYLTQKVPISNWMIFKLIYVGNPLSISANFLLLPSRRIPSPAAWLPFLIETLNLFLNFAQWLTCLWMCPMLNYFLTTTGLYIHQRN